MKLYFQPSKIRITYCRPMALLALQVQQLLQTFADVIVPAMELLLGAAGRAESIR